jgi:hypothetical protein
MIVRCRTGVAVETMLSPSLTRLLAAAREEDLRRVADARRREAGLVRPHRSLRARWTALRGRPASGARGDPEVQPQLDGTALTIRFAFPDDALALAQLAAVDSQDRAPSGPLLVAEADGELRAALSLRDDSVIADPFHPTTALVELLRARAEQLRSAARAPNSAQVARSARRHSDELQAGWDSSS